MCLGVPALATGRKRRGHCTLRAEEDGEGGICCVSSEGSGGAGGKPVLTRGLVSLWLLQRGTSREASGTWSSSLVRAVILALNCWQRGGETGSVFFLLVVMHDMWDLVP